ncbi:MAG: terminase family protein, partial [Bryobacteraceae bacterium]
DPLQARILDSTSHRLILLCCRQFGKSTLAAIKALHFALSRPNSTVLCVSPTLRRSNEWLRLVRHFFAILSTPRTTTQIPLSVSSRPTAQIPLSASSGPTAHTLTPTQAQLSASSGPNAHTLTPAQAHPRPTAAPAHPHSLSLPNASRILALPGTASSNRGYSAHLLLFEEAAFIPDPVFAALTPALAATNGALWLISSAGAPSGFFYDIWSNPAHPYTRFCATAHQCPRIPERHLVEARLALGELRFRREYLCHFTTDHTPLFPEELLQSALDDSFDPWILEAE